MYIYMHLTADQLLTADSEPEDRECRKGVNYAFDGLPCSISGDPHYVCYAILLILCSLCVSAVNIHALRTYTPIHSRRGVELATISRD